ncbi:MAG: FAD-dependent oxidoreductase [Rhodospirillales bacterium]|nr:FAD-dependent oxidoreductase [Rhodospirillales bacterium]
MADTHLVLGAGQAGSWAAMAMREAGFAGRILLLGAERVAPYERPPLSKAMLTAPAALPPPFFHPPERYAARDIALRLACPAAAIDVAAGCVVLEDGERVGFDRLLIATGGRARRLTIPGGQHALVLRDLDDAAALRARLAAAQRVICIGAGVIGLEVAASARTLGKAVTVLEEASRPMGRAVSAEAAAFIAGLHAAAGCTLRCATRVLAIEAAGGGFIVHTDAGTLAADLVVAGIGMERNQEIAAAAGIATDRGIVVDARGATSAPGIYAAGDVTAFPHTLVPGLLRLETWRHAQNHAIAVARALCGQDGVYDDVPWFWTDQYGVNFQVAGLPGQAVRTVLRPDARFLALHLDAENRLIGAEGADAARDIRAAERLIRHRRVLAPAMLADPALTLTALARQG